MFGSRDKFIRRFAAKREQEISCPKWTFYSANCCQIGKFLNTEGVNLLPLTRWFSRGSAVVQFTRNHGVFDCWNFVLKRFTGVLTQGNLHSGT